MNIPSLFATVASADGVLTCNTIKALKSNPNVVLGIDNLLHFKAAHSMRQQVEHSSCVITVSNNRINVLLLCAFFLPSFCFAYTDSTVWHATFAQL